MHIDHLVDNNDDVEKEFINIVDDDDIFVNNDGMCGDDEIHENDENN